jgi:radical SAM superfamily enzyme YgiQ (UPF0313 family)
MKVLLINPAFRKEVSPELERYFLGAGMRFPWSLLKRKNERPRYAMFPFFMAYAAGLLERGNFDVRVIDAVPLNLTEEELENRVKEFAPDVLVLEPNTAMINYSIQLVSRLKDQLNFQAVLTGSHATHFSDSLLKENPQIDLVINGEYEVKLLRLCKVLEEGKDLSLVKGINYRKADKILTTQDDEAIDLNQLPFITKSI